MDKIINYINQFVHQSFFQKMTFIWLSDSRLEKLRDFIIREFGNAMQTEKRREQFTQITKTDREFDNSAQIVTYINNNWPYSQSTIEKLTDAVKATMSEQKLEQLRDILSRIRETHGTVYAMQQSDASAAAKKQEIEREQARLMEQERLREQEEARRFEASRQQKLKELYELEKRQLPKYNTINNFILQVIGNKVRSKENILLFTLHMGIDIEFDTSGEFQKHLKNMRHDNQFRADFLKAVSNVIGIVYADDLEKTYKVDPEGLMQ